MSEAFSGQITRSGCGTPPGADRGGELAGAARVVVEHGRALGVEVQAQPRHVALHAGGAQRARLGVDRGGDDQPSAQHGGGRGGAGDRRRAAGRPGRPRAAAQGGDRLEQQQAGRRHRGRHQRCAAERGEVERGGLRLRERQPAPPEPAEGHAGLQGLDGDQRAGARQHAPGGAGQARGQASPSPSSPSSERLRVTSASQGSAPTCRLVHCSRGSRKAAACTSPCA